MLWFLLWFVLVAAAVGFFAYLGLHLYRQAKALTAALSAASDRLTEMARVLDDVPPPGPDTAVRL